MKIFSKNKLFRLRKKQIIKGLKMYVKHNRLFPFVKFLHYNEEFSYKLGIIKNLT